MSELKNLKKVLASSRATKQTVFSARSTSVQTNPANGLPVTIVQRITIAQQQTIAASRSIVAPKVLRKAPRKKLYR